MSKKILIAVLMLIILFQASAQEVENAVSKKHGNLNYLLSTPKNYNPENSHPTIIFLHGADRSNTKHHPAKYAKRANIDFPFIVIAPSCTSGCSWSSVDLTGILEQASKSVSIDPDRVYLTGYSMGGAGTWANLKKINHLLAAAAPMAPAGGSTNNICVASDVAVRVYHGTADYGFANSQKMVAKLKDCSNSVAELIPLEGQGHGIWPAILSDKSFYDWLLRYSRK